MRMKKLINIVLCVFIYSGITLGTELYSVLSTPDEHTRFIRSSLANAHTRVVIVSPFITFWRLEDRRFNGNDGLGKPIKAAIERGFEVCVFTDERFDANKEWATKGREFLASLGVDLKIVSRLHSKNLIVDNECITFGSFNWLSADTNRHIQVRSATPVKFC